MERGDGRAGRFLPDGRRGRCAQDQPPAPVTVASVTKGSVASTVTATGTVVSRNDARLAAEVAGRLDWVAEPGTRVQKGAPLARVDTRGLELHLARERRADRAAECERGTARHAARAPQCAAGRHRLEEPDRRGRGTAVDGAPRTRAGPRDARQHAPPGRARSDPRAVSRVTSPSASASSASSSAPASRCSGSPTPATSRSSRARRSRRPGISRSARP